MALPGSAEVTSGGTSAVVADAQFGGRRRSKLKALGFTVAAIGLVVLCMAVSNSSNHEEDDTTELAAWSKIRHTPQYFDWTYNIFHDLPTNEKSPFYWDKLKARTALGDTIEAAAGLTKEVKALHSTDSEVADAIVKLTKGQTQSAKTIDKISDDAANVRVRVKAAEQRLDRQSTKINNVQSSSARAHQRLNSLSRKVNSDEVRVNAALKELQRSHTGLRARQKQAAKHLTRLAKRLTSEAKMIKNNLKASEARLRNEDNRMKARMKIAVSSAHNAHRRIDRLRQRVSVDERIANKRNKSNLSQQQNLRRNARRMVARISATRKTIAAVNSHLSNVHGKLNRLSGRVSRAVSTMNRNDKGLLRRVRSLASSVHTHVRNLRKADKNLLRQVNSLSKRMQDQNNIAKARISQVTRRAVGNSRALRHVTSRVSRYRKDSLRQFSKLRKDTTKLHRYINAVHKINSMRHRWIRKAMRVANANINKRIARINKMVRAAKALSHTAIHAFYRLRRRVGHTQAVVGQMSKNMNTMRKVFKGHRMRAGPPGPRGRRGPSGVPGRRGIRGRTGASGRPGRPGPRGRRGPRGSTGRAGRNGRHGITRVIHKHHHHRKVVRVTRRRRRRLYKRTMFTKLALRRRAIYNRKHITSSKQYSYLFWYRPMEAARGHWRNIFLRGRNNHGRTPALWLYPRYNRVHVRVGSKRSWNDGCDPPQHLALGKWVHIAVTLGRGRLDVYFNGKRVCAKAYPDSVLVRPSGPLQVGFKVYQAARGYLSNFRVYNYPVHQNAVRRVARGTRPRTAYARIQTLLNFYCMDVLGAKRHKGNAVVMYRCHGGRNQLWRWQRNGQIRSRLTGMCLDIRGSSRKAGAKLHMWPCHRGANQRFYIDKIGRIRSRMNHYCVDIWRASRRPLAPLVSHPCHNGHNQKWRLN